jgi:formate hydrogenlyase subunit 6/NADH:ubiquinone oxidoreductase subunit I
MACTEVCPTGALARIPARPERVAAEVRIGVPVLDRKGCLAWNGEGVCSLCAYVCPVGSRAVELVGSRQAPLFHAAGCVGCGLCEEACPEQAQAIRIVPAATGGSR